MRVITKILQETAKLIYLSCQDNTTHVPISEKGSSSKQNTQKRLREDNWFLMRYIFLWYEKQLDQRKRVCVLVCFAGGGVPNLAWRGGAEVCVVISCQRQGQVYLCDTANLGPSAHSWHPDSESCPGNFVDKLGNSVACWSWNTEMCITFTQNKRSLFLSFKNLKVFSVSHWSGAASHKSGQCVIINGGYC